MEEAEAACVRLVNLACFAGKWGKLAQLGRGTSRRDVMVEVSSTHKPAVNHISGSRKCRCSFFGHAWIQGLERFPDGTIVHSKRVKEETLWWLWIPAQQTSSTPAISISRKSLRNENIAHFHASAEIAAAVIAAASFDDRNNKRKDMLSRVNVQESFARRHWRRFVHSLTENRRSNSDERVNDIEQYLCNLGPRGGDADKQEFVEACFDVLRGDSDDMITQKTWNTIAWQRRQLYNVRITLAVLLNKGVIKTTLTKEKATKKYVRDLSGRLEAIVDKVSDRLWQIPKIRDMLFSSGDELIHAFFQEGHSLLLYNVVHNHRNGRDLEAIAQALEDPSVIL